MCKYIPEIDKLVNSWGKTGAIREIAKRGYAASMTAVLAGDSPSGEMLTATLEDLAAKFEEIQHLSEAVENEGEAQ